MCTYKLNLGLIGSLFLVQNMAHAQVVTDGTTGAREALEGPDYEIGADLGTEAGDNLFHSFDEFSIGTGESATFTGPDNIDNIISRVTGGDISSIDGLIASSIPGANLWLFNPAGVVFGANASLDVSGSFHVSTADELRTADGGTFSAVDPQSSGFSVAEPESFGFLNADPAAITIAGSQLEVGDGETLSVVGGDIEIDDGALLAVEAGELNLLAADGEAEANVTTGTLTGADGGDISVGGGSAVAAVGDGGGAIRIEGGAFVVDEGSAIVSTNTGATDGDVGVSIKTESASIDNGSVVVTNALADGRGGSIDVEADSVQVADSSISSGSSGTGTGGDINITGETVAIRDGGFALSATEGGGNGGDVNVEAGRLVLADGDLATVTTETASGNGGDISVAADSLELRTGGLNEGGSIRTASLGSGDAGNIDIRGGDVVADANGQLGGAAIQSISDGAGSAGRIRLSADRLELRAGAIISADARGGASTSNNIEVTANRIIIDNEGLGDVITGITLTIIGESTSTGTIIVDAGDLSLVDGGLIQSITANDNDAANISITAKNLTIDGDLDSAFPSQISSSVSLGADGNGGEITIVADNIDMRGRAEITASTLGDGDAGSIDITVKNDLDMRGESEISTSTEFIDGEARSSGNAGVIVIETSGLLVIEESSISSSTSGSGDGGSIAITAERAVFDGEGFENFSGVTTQATVGSSGDAGDIALSIGNLTLRNDAQISSTSFSEGNAGNVSIRSGRITIDATDTDSEFITGIVSAVDTDDGSDGNAGAITIEADRLDLLGEGAEISSSNFGSGAAGTIDIQLSESLALLEGADITTISESGGGGGITIGADDFIVATGPRSTISTTVADDSGNAGDILIETQLLALGDARILARADEGRGGDIQISADDLVLSPTAEINAEAGATGVDGTVAVSAPEVDLTAGLVALDGRFLDVSSLLRERCAARRADDSSSFTLGTGGSLPTDFDAPRLSLLRTSPEQASGQKTVLVLPCPQAAS